MKNNYPKTAYTFFSGRSIFRYFLRLNWCNFCTVFTKSIKVNVLEIALLPLKTDQNSHFCRNPVRNNVPLKVFKNYDFKNLRCYFEKRKR